MSKNNNEKWWKKMVEKGGSLPDLSKELSGF